MRSLIFSAILLAIFSFTSFAQTTVYAVTSTADSGPGTLRQGLLDAAVTGRTVPFKIEFQLPGAGTDNANRTIRLRTALPTITSNTIIDGSTQSSWTPLGVSGAKIILEPEFPNSTFNCLTIGQFFNTTTDQTSNVEVYGLYIRNFAAISNLQTINMSQGSGIVIDYRTNNVTIGAPGKGNVIGGNIYGIVIRNNNLLATTNPVKIKIQSNIIGLLYDGVTPVTNVYGINATLYDCALDVGGDNAGEGNVVAANRINIEINRPSTTTPRFDVNVINNKIGVDYSGHRDYHELPLYTTSSSIEISGLKINTSNTALYVRNNVIGGHRNFGLYISNADFIVTGNAIGSNVTGTVAMGNGYGIKLEGTSTGTIGGTTTVAESNIVANNTYGIETTSTKPVKITRNSMFCNKEFGIGKTLTTLQPFVQILKQRSNYLSGRATANSEIEIFYTENCSGLCEGKTYLTTVQAGSDGRWEYNGTLTGKVTATASLLNATTSPFATAELLANEAVVEPVSCKGLGSITIPEPREGFTFSWAKVETDGTKVPKGGGQSITNLEVGRYEVTIDDNCKPYTMGFDIKDQILVFDNPPILYTAPTCGQTSFTLTGNVKRGKGVITYKWYSIANPTVVFRTGVSVSVPEGEYFLEITDEAGCAPVRSATVKLTRKPQPRIAAAGTSTPEHCGEKDGTYDIKLDDITGTPRFEWYKHDPQTGLIGTTVVWTEEDLKNAETGSYSVKVYDSGTCSPVTFGPFAIGLLNNVTISSVATISEKCGRGDGGIPNPTIANANYYEWRNPDGSLRSSGVYSTGMSIALSNLTAGTYTLIAKNTANPACGATQAFIVAATSAQSFPFSKVGGGDATCELVNGSIKLEYSGLVPTKFQWEDEIGTVYPGTAREVKNLPAGKYSLHILDVNNCPVVLGPFTIISIPKLAITQGTGKPLDDQCNLGRGSITGVQVVGGLVNNYTFKWVLANDHTKSVQYTKDLVDVPMGSYQLIVEDGTTCPATSEVFTIGNQVRQLETPNVADIRVCYVSDIKVPIIGPQEGIYEIYLDPAAAPLMDTKNGIFNFTVSKTNDYYIRRKLGSCVSDFVKMHIEVTHDNLEIGNVITPNGDGLNDYWMLKGLPDFKGNNVKVYSRSGQLVYESIGNYTKPFDGTFRDKQLPAGVYFYVIDLRAECKPISGSITLLR